MRAQPCGRQAQQRAGRPEAGQLAYSDTGTRGRDQGDADRGGDGQRQRTGERGHRDRGGADRYRMRGRRELPGGEHRERGRGQARGQRVHPLVGAAAIAQLEDEDEQTPHPERADADQGRARAVGGQQRDIGGQTAQEGERDALAGLPHAVEPEPAAWR